MNIEATPRTPGVEFDPEAGKFHIYGSSYPEDSNVFYAPLLSSMEHYLVAPNETTMAIFSLFYVNSGSMGRVRRLLDQLVELHDSGDSKVQVVWEYEPEDDDQAELAKDMRILYPAPPLEIKPTTFDFPDTR